MRKGYDTIFLFLSREYLPIGYSLEDYVNKEHISYIINSKGEIKSSTLKMDNLSITLNSQGLSIKNSFCNFSQKDGLKSFCELELMELLKCIGDTYGVDIFKSKVTRLDFFYDIEMMYSPDIYILLLLSKPRFKVHQFEMNKNFKTNAIEYAIYDKSKERKEIGNKLRFELRLKKNVKAKLNELGFNLNSLTAQDLCTLNFRQQLEKILVDGYISIKKDELALSKDAVKDYKSLKTYIMQVGIKSIGLENIYKELKTYKRDGYIEPHQFYRFIKYLTNVNNAENYSATSHFIEEFNAKMLALQNLQV